MLKVDPETGQPFNPGPKIDGKPYLEWISDNLKEAGIEPGKITIIDDGVSFCDRGAATLPYLRTFAELVAAFALVGLFVIAWVALPA